MKDIFEGAGEPLTKTSFDSCLAELGANAESLWSVLRVETNGFGFFNDRRPKILFERHVFRGRTRGTFDAKFPDLSNKTAGGYAGGPAEYGRLKRAMLLDRKAALESASWGLGQVMGFNANKIGYASCDAMIAAFAASEEAQLRGCIHFIGATAALKAAFAAQQWARFAFFYNGPTFRVNDYDTKLATAFAAFSRPSGCPSVELRRAQAYLTYLGFQPNGIDGVPGKGTKSAIAAFSDSYSKPAGGPALPATNSSPEEYNGCLSAAFKLRFAA